MHFCFPTSPIMLFYHILLPFLSPLFIISPAGQGNLLASSKATVKLLHGNTHHLV